MECHRARLGLYALVDDELEVADALEVLDHLESCEGCRQEFEMDAHLRGLVGRRVAACEPDPRLWEKIRAEIRNAGERGRRRTGLRRLILPQLGLRVAAISAVVVAAVGLLSFLAGQSARTHALVGELVGDYAKAQARLESGARSAAPDSEVVKRAVERFPFAVTPHKIAENLGHVETGVCYLKETAGVRLTYEDGTKRERVGYYQLDGSTVRLPWIGVSSRRSGPFYVDQHWGRHVVLWEESGVLYGLVSEQPAEDLLSLAAQMKRRDDAPLTPRYGL